MEELRRSWVREEKRGGGSQLGGPRRCSGRLSSQPAWHGWVGEGGAGELELPCGHGCWEEKKIGDDIVYT